MARTALPRLSGPSCLQETASPVYFIRQFRLEPELLLLDSLLDPSELDESDPLELLVPPFRSDLPSPALPSLLAAFSAFSSLSFFCWSSYSFLKSCPSFGSFGVWLAQYCFSSSHLLDVRPE